MRVVSIYLKMTEPPKSLVRKVKGNVKAGHKRFAQANTWRGVSRYMEGHCRHAFTCSAPLSPISAQAEYTHTFHCAVQVLGLEKLTSFAFCFNLNCSGSSCLDRDYFFKQVKKKNKL